MFFALQEGRTGVLKILRDLYPDGVEQKWLDPWGRPYLYFFSVPSPSCGANRGLRDTGGHAFPNFPLGLPEKPFQAHLRGSLWVDQSGPYRYRMKGPSRIAQGGKCPWLSPRPLYLARGFHPLDFVMQSAGGKDAVQIEECYGKGAFHPLSPDRFIPFSFPPSWEGTYWTSTTRDSTPVLVQIDPLLNFSNSADFPVKNAPNLLVEWRGILHPRQPGLYHFLMLSSDHTKAEMDVDGKKAGVSNREFDLLLGRKDYHAVIHFQKTGGVENSFHLVWKPPGVDHYEVLAPEAPQ
jgi:hypothetical protein